MSDALAARLHHSAAERRTLRRFVLAVVVAATIAAAELLVCQQGSYARARAPLATRSRPHGSPKTTESEHAVSGDDVLPSPRDAPPLSVASSASVSRETQLPTTSSYATSTDIDTATADARPVTLYVRFIDPFAGIGNKMFQYAGGVGLALRHGVDARLVVDSEAVANVLTSMRRVFHMSPLPEQPAVPDVATLAESGWGRYDAARFDNRSNFAHRNTTVVGYLQSWRYFEPVAGRIRREFTLTPFADAFADAFLRQTGAGQRGQVIVGLHVRRGDMENRPDLYTLAPPEYVLKAVDHYLAKYGHGGDGGHGGHGGDGAQRRGLTLVVATNNRRWVEDTLVPHLPANVSVAFTGFTAEEDMAVLSRCNHSIVTAGTFGWWSAWLAGGDVVYYKDFIRSTSPLYASHLPSDYYPPHWLGLS